MEERYKMGCGEVVIIRMPGNLYRSPEAVEEFTKRVENLLAEGTKYFLFDLKECEDITPDILHGITQVFIPLKFNGGEAKLMNPTDRVLARLVNLQIAGNVFDVYFNEGQALHSFNRL